MSNLRTIALHLQNDPDGPAGHALLSVVSVRGSAYRRPGAHMLASVEGRLSGVLSGGCLEEDLLLRARRVLQEGGNVRAVYDLTEADEPVWGLGLGCPGIVQVLIEPLDRDCVEQMRAAAADEEASVLAVTLPPVTGPAARRRLRVDAAGCVTHGSGDAALDDAVTSLALEALAAAASMVRVVETPQGDLEVFLEFVPPLRHLLIFGGGPDAAPLVEMAADLGWAVTVVDHRPAFADPGRYPQARMLLATDYATVLEDVAPGAQHAVAIMTHQFDRDLALLQRLLTRPPGYLGLLGSRDRREALLARLPDALEQSAREHLSAPIGLDIGAESPREIALSILADIQATFTRRSGGVLRGRQGSIHDRITTPSVLPHGVTDDGESDRG